MHEIKVIVNEKERIFSAPSNFEEMLPKQFMEVIKWKTAGVIPTSDEFIATMTNMPADIVKKFYPYHKYMIKEMFGYILTDELSFKGQKMSALKCGNKLLFGYDSNFGNVTWEEFIWADQSFILKDYKTMIAVLYRKMKPKFNGEEDKRIPFTKYGIEDRKKLIDKLDKSTITALILIYKAMRHACLEEKYDAIFPYHEKVSGDEMPEPPEPNEPEEKKFSWVKVHQNLMGDNIVQEQQFLKLSVHTVLNRLNTAIIENRKSKK
jgi:hypothetical protein